MGIVSIIPEHQEAQIDLCSHSGEFKTPLQIVWSEINKSMLARNGTRKIL